MSVTYFYKNPEYELNKIAYYVKVLCYDLNIHNLYLFAKILLDLYSTMRYSKSSKILYDYIVNYGKYIFYCENRLCTINAEKVSEMDKMIMPIKVNIMLAIKNNIKHINHFTKTQNTKILWSFVYYLLYTDSLINQPINKYNYIICLPFGELQDNQKWHIYALWCFITIFLLKIL